MEENKKNLINKIPWTYKINNLNKLDKELFNLCKSLEDEGFGMLASDFNSSLIDTSDSIVCPNGLVFTPRQIEDYWIKRRGYSSDNSEDVMMHKARMYYMGFKGE